MNADNNPSARFNAASKMTAQTSNIHARADKAIERLSARHEANEARHVNTRFAKLLRQDTPAPTLKPSWAIDDRRSWLMRAAKYQIAREHSAHITKVRAVANAMTKTPSQRQQSQQRGRDGLGR